MMERLFKNIKNVSINNKKLIISFGIMLVVSLLMGISYSFYIMSKTQQGSNIISSACFKLTLEDKNDISLTDTMPLTEEEGNNLVPYEFTIKNVCDMAASYQVNLETLNGSTLETTYLRSKIDEDSSVVLGSLEEVDTFINDNVKESRKIKTGILLKNEEVTYKLNVWVDNDSTTEQSADKSWIGKVVVIALMNKNPYRILTLNPTGGELNSTSMEVVEGRVVGELPIPMRLGYVFNGWFTEEENGEQITEFTTINENQEVYAHWNKGKYDLVVNPNEGEWESFTSNQTYHLDYEEEKEINDPVRTGYHFTNWTLEGQESSINNKVFKMGYENATLTANYERNSYKLNVVDTYGNDEEVNLLYEEEKTIENPTREGYTFTGWKVEGNGSTIENNTFKMGYEDATLRAQWEANDYPYIALHYQENINDNNYTLVDADTEEGNLPYGTKKIPSVKTYTGFTSPQAKEITIEVDTYPPTKNKVEYQYSRNKYSITINPNSGSYNSSTTNTVINDVKYQKETTINDPTRVGYTFNGWTKSGNATLTNKVLTMGSENVTLTAGWTINTYTITYNANGGSVSPASATVNHGSTLTLPSPTRTGYAFDGWFTESSGGSQVTNTTQWTSSQTIYAHWTATTYTITYTLNSGSCSTCPIAYTVDTSTFMLPTPTREGYDFLGWTGSNGTTAQTTVTISKGSTGNRTYTANWEESRIKTTDLKVGDIVYYNTSGNQGTISEWVVIKAGSEPELVSKIESPDTYTLSGQNGFLNAIYFLNQQAASYGTNTNIVKSTRHMGYSNQTQQCSDMSNCPTDNGYEIDVNLVKNAMNTTYTGKIYWFASRYVGNCSGGADFCVRAVKWDRDDYLGSTLFRTNVGNYSDSYAIRPIITLKQSVKFIKSDNIPNTYYVYSDYYGTNNIPSSLEVGDTIYYNVSGNMGTISEWVVIKAGSEPELVSKFQSPNLFTLSGQDGYLNAVYSLNQQAASYGTNKNIVKSTRHMGYSNQTQQCSNMSNCPTDNGYETDFNLVKNAMNGLVSSRGSEDGYWLSSREVFDNDNSYRAYSVRYINDEHVAGQRLRYLLDGTYHTLTGKLPIRPIITLNSTTTLLKTITNHYELIQ